MTQIEHDVLDTLRAELDVTPSPEFQARVRMALTAQARRPQIWRPWMVAAAGVSLGLAALVILRPHASAPEPTSIVPIAAVQPHLTAIPDATRAASVPRRARSLGPVTPRAQARRRSREPVVQVPPGQLQLLRAYAAASQTGGGAAAHVVAPVVDAVPPVIVEPVVVAVVAAPVVDLSKG